MSAVVTFSLPPEIERVLRASAADYGSAAKEALAVSLFQQGKLTHAELGHSLGLDRFETDGLLQRHRVTQGAPSLADLEADRASLDKVLGPVRT